MRVFLPSTLPALAEVLRAGQVGSDPGPQPGYAVTPALREAYASGDEDARCAVDGAEGYELGWYATQELPYLAG